MPDDALVGEKLGGYEIHGELGSGGMGSVYLAEVTAGGFGLDGGLKPGEKVALKVIHQRLLESPGFFKRFVQEAELGKRVRHANVVRTYDADAIVHKGQHYHFLVMEYVEGKSLRELHDELGTIPETLLREIALQAAAGLAAIHADGIVHRDIKPENILITDDHDIRVMDLGVAKVQDAAVAITTVGCFAGSLLYAAPEHFLSDEVGTSVDLYSLGVMLHELATHEAPFPRNDVAALIRAHAEFVPPRLADIGDTTPFFSALVACLLEKNPGDRFESADALRAVLEQGEPSRWWTEQASQEHETRAYVPQIRVRRETRLHGRAKELRALRAAWDRAQAGEGNAILVEGEPGIGKTRLVDAFLREVDGASGNVLYGSYAPSGGFGALSDAIVGKFGERDLARRLAPHLSLAPSLVTAFASLLKHEGPPTGADPLPRDALAATCVQLMRALAEQEPLIWIVEDLNHASAESRDLALALARAAESESVLLLFTARPGMRLEEFSQLHHFQRVLADRLGAREVFELLEDAFKNETLAETLGAKIARKSDGVPLFVFEMIRGLAEDKFLRREPDGRYVQTGLIEEIDVPSAVRDLIDGRLRGLPDEQRRILDVGAVIGMVFDPALIVAVLEQKRVRILQHLAEIERSRGLVHGEAGSTRFDQNQIQEVLYQDLPPDLRAEYHTLIADAYAARGDAASGSEDAVFLASHYLRGNEPRDAGDHLDPALDTLERTSRYEEAFELSTRALETPDLLQSTARADVLLRKARLHRVRGEHETVRAALDEARHLADECGESGVRARVRIALGMHARATSDLTAALKWHEEALALAHDADDVRLRGKAADNVAHVLRNLGRYDEAQTQFRASLAMARERGDKKWETEATISVGLVAWNLGRGKEAREHFENALALARETGDRFSELNATGNLGIVFQNTGRLAEARAQYEQTLALAREIGNRRAAAYATGNLGSILSDAGRLEEARGYFQKTRALTREIGDKKAESRAIGKLATDLVRLGRLEDARTQLDECLAGARNIGSRRQEGEVLARIAQLAKIDGRPDRAREAIAQSVAIQRELGAKHNLAIALVVLGQIEATGGNPDNATSHLDEALALAHELDAPNVTVFATTERARLPGGKTHAAAAAAVLEKHQGHIDHEVEMEARYRMWQRTDGDVHLREAHRLLEFLREHAPKSDRESMVRNVPLHQAIMTAWNQVH